MLHKPSGRLGNQLFQMNFLLQIKTEFILDTFYKGFDQLHFLEVKNRIKFPNSIYFRKPRSWTSQQISNIGWLEFVDQIVNQNSVNVINPGILGEWFFESCVFDPNDFFKISPKIGSNPESKNIAIHFRGGDFVNWDKQAILPFQYYVDSIDLVKSLWPSNKLNFNIYSDEPKHPTLSRLSQHLGITVSDKNDPVNDFLSISQSDCLISSPSTFSIWSGMLGKKKVVIHSKLWFDSRIEMKQKFWIELDKGGNKYLTIDYKI